MEQLYKYLEEAFELKDNKTNLYSPLVLAYLGDAVYDIIIRTIVVNEGNMQVSKMHRKTKDFVKASAQAKIYFLIEPLLTKEEIEIFKRGRNAKSGTKAKNASINEYRIATGFEALIGFLYLEKEYKRIIDLIAEGVKICRKAQRDS